MSDPGRRPPIREMQRSLVNARDEQITKVVAMVDGLADRSKADALIAPLRPRLAQLRPPRPLRLARLLFLPLECLIVPAPRWRPGQPAVPRTALLPLTDVVRAGAPAVALQAETMTEGRNTADRAAITAAGSLLWAAASRALAAAARPPRSWTENGLPAEVFPAMARAVAAVLEQAMTLDRLAEESHHGMIPAEAVIARVLAAGAGHGPEGWGMTVATLLGRLADPGPIIGRLAGDLASQTDRAARARAEYVADAMLERLDAPDPGAGLIAGTDLADAGAEVRRAALLLDALDRPGASPMRRKRVQALRQQLDASSRARFTCGIEQGFAAPLRDQMEAGGAIAVEEFEAAARSLRQLEGAGRKLGGAPVYDALLRRSADTVRAMPETENLTRADKVRMVEILAGPEAALDLLAA